MVVLKGSARQLFVVDLCVVHHSRFFSDNVILTILVSKSVLNVLEFLTDDFSDMDVIGIPALNWIEGHGNQLFVRLVTNDTGTKSAATLLRGYAKVEPLTIAKLSQFIITAETQKIEFICIGKVTYIKAEKYGATYLAPSVQGHILLQVCKDISCSKCARKLHKSASSFACMFCNQTNADGVFRYCVEMTVADDPDEAVFVKFLWGNNKAHQYPGC
ncbi:hypothetical protein N665_0068s0033 [Sinapis alba]|nr:hypothetical protein N665_0068s0033 [Sinapis alba]